MKRSTLIFLAGLALLVGLVVFELHSLGVLGGDDGADGGGGADLLGADAVDGEDAATLKGRGTGKAARADEHVAAPDPFDGVPAEVRGTTKNGGSIRGRVVREEGGLPLAGVRVTLGRPDSLVSYLRAKANGRFDELEARTGPDGRFAFLDVTPSKGYVVRARHSDYAVCSHPDTLDLTGRGALDVGDLALGQGGTLTGRVVGPDGTPLRNVRVAVTWRITNALGIVLADPATAPEIEREVVTGADGRYKAAKLDPSPKTIIAVAPTGATAVVRSVALEKGELKAVDDIRMPGPGRIAGKVVWADGSPIEGARVFAAPSQQAAVRTVETGADGAFELRWLPEGQEYVIGTMVAGLPVDLTMGVDLGDEDVRIEFPKPGGLKGVVVTAEGGRPLTRFGVSVDLAEPPEDWQRRFVMEQVKRGLGPTPFESEQGAFEFPRLATSTYHVTVSAPGYPDVTKEGVTIVAGETTEVRIEIPRGHVASGVVRRHDGSPLAGARVYVQQGIPSAAAGPALDGYLHDREPDAVADAGGRFTLPPQTPATYDLIAKHPTALAGILRGVDLEAGDVQDLELRMPQSGTIRGRLLDEHARPARGEQVYVLYRNGVVRTTSTGDDGRFEVAGLPVGRLVVRWLSLLDVRAYRELMHGGNDPAAREKAFDDLAARAGEQDLRDGAVLEVQLAIPRRVEVRGRYTVGGEPPAKQRRFYVTVEGGGQWNDVAIAEDGSYTMRLLPGSYLVYGPDAAGRWSARPIEILEGPSQTLDIDVE